MVNVSTIPDYSSQAAAELKLEASRWSVCVQRVIDNLDDEALVKALLQQTLQLKNAASVLGYSSMRFGMAEVAEVLHYWLKNPINEKDTDDYALVLLQASDELQAITSLSVSQAKRASAVRWLPIVDNCRACRQVPALSKDVVAAAGIALPSSANRPMPAKQDCEDFLTAIQAVHKTFARQLMVSLRDKQSVEQLASSSNTFLRLADACKSENRLSALEPLFRAAGVVLASVVDAPDLYSMALQRLYARLERFLAQLSKMQPDVLARTANLVPDDILRQLLFYVARFSHHSADAKKLNSDFGLHVLATEAVGPIAKDSSYRKLRAQVLQQILIELKELQSWMNQAASDPKHKRAKLLFKRLGEQHLAAGILGLDELECSLANLRESVRNLKQSQGDSESRLQMASNILQVQDLIQALPQNSHQSAPTKPASENSIDAVAAKLKHLSRPNDKNQFHSESVKSCLQAVQGELHQAEPELLAVFAGNPEINASAADIADRFDASARALKLLPLPEVAPLIEGLASAIRNEASADSDEHYRNNIAQLLVALDLYIGSLVTESKSLTPLLQKAVAAMRSLSVTVSDNADMQNALTQAIASNPIPKPDSNSSQSLDPNSISNSENANERLLDVFLTANQQINPWAHDRTDALTDVLPALSQLGLAAENASLSELHGLVTNCAEYIQQVPMPDDAKELVSETLLVVPQMLHAEPGVNESVRGLDTLKARLSISASHAETNALMDNTLQNVFARECTAHIETLRHAIRVARADLPLSKLPSDDMLRALHTLSGCTQTVDAIDIVAIVQPLQKSALSLQRSGQDFSDEETDYIDQLADAMEARLHHFQHQEDVDAAVLDVEARLPDFVSTVLARTRSSHNEIDSHDVTLVEERSAPAIAPAVLAKSNSVETNEAGLSSIFRAEADDLMLRLRSHTARLLDAGDKSEKEGALRVLHTIKGSARMSGNHAMADAAHELETDVADVADGKAFGEILRQRLPELQACLAPENHVSGQANSDGSDDLAKLNASESLNDEDTLIDDTVAIAGNDTKARRAEPIRSTSNYDESLESLLKTGSTLVSRQAEVDGRIAFLSDHIRDIQASAVRLQRLATDNPAFDSVASRELVADIQVAQRQLDQSLGQLQHVHGLASHAGTALHRALVQARLRNVESIRPRLEAALSDATTICERDANLLLTGGDVAVSANVLNAVAPLLEQLIRNAVAHGLDSQAVREAAHKPADGEIAIAARLDGTDLLIDVSDDGEGVDEDELNQQRLDDGLQPIRGAKHLREILCSPGYSTLDDATPVAGRGQGLAMVLDGIEALSGELEVLNDPGEGLTVRMRIPQPMVVAKSLVFGEGALLHAIPVGYIAHVLPMGDSVDVIQHDNQAWPVCTIEQLMGGSAPTQSSADRCALIKVRGENLAIPVPSLSGYQELIVQPLGSQMQSLERYVGGAVLSDGRNALIVNVHRLFQQRLMNQSPVNALSDQQTPVKLRTALIADDSVTMRVAGERLLQRLGFQVHTARDGLEALDFLKRGLPSVLLLDIEMPGADGFDVVRRSRAKLVAAEVPVIMISTRRGPAERERARSLGIQHLIHKPYTETRLREALEEVGVLEAADDVN